jgi:hypothetical protein
MIYGYVNQIVNEEFGLAQMREISVSAPSASLRALAEFLRTAAEELDAKPRSVHWHMHLPNELRESLGCDVIVTATNDCDLLNAEMPPKTQRAHEE